MGNSRETREKRRKRKAKKRLGEEMEKKRLRKAEETEGKMVGEGAEGVAHGAALPRGLVDERVTMND